jgi:hypothetical protein
VSAQPGVHAAEEVEEEHVESPERSTLGLCVQSSNTAGSAPR